ncbi:redoxin family protein [Sphingobacterium tabacisoli]|uniref:Redoxin family protein n=1 Tax=Sphingobacterium tabacisoli TaxID=2044855 RepID=A0ABW5L6E1_9SPHI|nr:redoxin family protein [Sphingobacterium tabacisoli]
MQTKKILLVLFTTWITMLQAQNTVQKPTFGIGSEVDRYPEVTWLQGTPVTSFDKDKTYIIECWATWCGPCIAAIPHMNELHKEYGDKVVIVGQSAMENDLRKVETFLKSKGDGMSYRVAYAGGSSGAFSKEWLIPGQIRALPHTIVIQENKVIWMPHPNELTKEVVESLINRSFNPAQMGASLHGDPIVEVRTLIRSKEYTKATSILDSILLKEPNNTEALVVKSTVMLHTGHYDEAVQLLMSEHERTLSSAVAYRLYQTLQEGNDSLTLKALIEHDIDRGLLTNNTALLDIVSEGYKIYALEGDGKNLADFIQRVRLKSTVSNPLLAMLAISPYYPIEDNTGDVTKELFETADHFFKMSQMEFIYLYKLVGMFWEKGERDNALQILNMSIAAGRRDGLPENRLEAMNELATKILKGEFPSEEQFRILMDHARQ